MLEINTGTYGAKRASWRDFNPRNVLQHIIDENPDGPESRWRDLFWQYCQDHPDDCMQAVAQYFCDNAIRYILDGRNDQRRQAASADTEAVAATKTRMKSRVRDHVVREAQILLLDLTMPNGKKLAQCTGKECQDFGSWYAVLATKVGPKKKVGDVLSEGEVRKAWLAKP